jgi:hypothetical protein
MNLTLVIYCWKVEMHLQIYWRMTNAEKYCYRAVSLQELVPVLSLNTEVPNKSCLQQ